MLRGVYRGLVLLHPAAFQERFGQELIWIFDINDPEYSSFALIVDCFVSLFRQWLFHSRLWIFGVSLLINCFVFQKMVEYFVSDLRKLLAAIL